MQGRLRVAATLATCAAAALAMVACAARDDAPAAAPLAKDASGCDGAPRPPRTHRPAAVAIFDARSGTVVRSANLGDALLATLAGPMLITDAGDGWLRAFRLGNPIEIAWCLELGVSSDLGGSVAGLVQAGNVVAAASGRTVVGVEPRAGTVMWSASADGPIAGLSGGATHVYAWTAPGGSQGASILALRASDGARAWPHVLSPCAADIMAGGTNGDPSGGCITPAGPGRVIESGGTAVFHAPGPARVTGIDIGSGLPIWQLDAGRSVQLAVADDIILALAYETGGLLGIRPKDGSAAFAVQVSGFTLAAAPGVALMLDQRLGEPRPDEQPRPPANTAMVARRTADGSPLWTAEVPGLPQSVDLVDGLAIVSSGEDIAAVRLTDGTLAWRSSLASPSLGGPFSVATSWQAVGRVSEGIVAVAAAERPYRD